MNAETKKKLVFTVPFGRHKILASAVGYHEDLILGNMLGSIEQSHAKDLEQYADDGFFSEIQPEVTDFTIRELMKFGVTSLYHLWERQTTALLHDHLGSPLPKQKKGQGAVAHLLGLLEHDLSAPTAPAYRNALEECRQLANAIKHDVTDGFHKLEKGYPVHFIPGPKPSVERFCIHRDELRRLFRAVEAFWENIPHETDNSVVQDLLSGKRRWLFTEALTGCKVEEDPELHRVALLAQERFWKRSK